MDVMNIVQTKMGWVPPGIMRIVEKYARRIPSVQRMIESEYDTVMNELESDLKPYRDVHSSFSEIPAKGKSKTAILKEMAAMKKKEEDRWKKGYVSGAVYHGDDRHIDFLNKVYAIHSQANPLHSDLWPSATKFEAEVVSMTARMLGAEEARLPEDGKGRPELIGDGEGVCGSVSSGGTESILLAMKTYRDFAREQRGVTRPNMVVPVTAHAAFDKASQYFGIKQIKIPVGPDYRVDVEAARRSINRNTVVVVGSAPSFPHGVVDDIATLSEIARKKGIGFHADACLGAFILPFARKLGYDVPEFDFRLPGVTSISADTHKFGYAAKGTSVILYRSIALRHYQYYTVTEWPGGMYFSPTFAGSRAGALSAVCWAALVSMGEAGYLEATAKILETGKRIREGIEKIPELKILGNPLWVIAFASESLDIYRVMEYMTSRGWNLNGLHRPACVHICVTLRHTQSGVVARFLKDLRGAVDFVKENPATDGGMAPVYGMAASLPMRGVVADMLKRYLDLLYRV
ncbi:MAG: aminotransferase class V-fold PLP-dependent enzyme [bacterium]|nr:aminotransferase class V-fold PLP-dependent enzyme [bacterium]